VSGQSANKRILEKAHAPKPAIARPIINVFEVGDTAQTRDPISKVERAVKKTHFTLKNV
jgi:hypothetical protein